MFLDQKLISAIIFEVNDSSLNYSLRPCTSIATVRVYGSSTFSVVLAQYPLLRRRNLSTYFERYYRNV